MSLLNIKKNEPKLLNCIYKTHFETDKTRQYNTKKKKTSNKIKKN
jgi:hypothetical protein